MSGASLRRTLGAAALLALATALPQPAAGQDRVATVFAYEEALTGDDSLRLRWPTAVAVGGAGEIAVADAAGPSLVILRDSGGGEGWVVDRSIALPAPAYSLACGAEEYLISTRRPGVLLSVRRSDYSLRERALPPEITPGAATCLADGQLAVHDLAGGRLVVVDGAGKLRASVGLAATVGALTAGAGGGFYATLPETGEVRRYGANGEPLATLVVPGLAAAAAWPVGLLVEDNGEVIVADRQAGRILVLEASGRWIGSGSRQGWEPGLLRYPAGIARLPSGELVVADQGNGRVQLFRRIRP